jgi:hypothetical protein
MSFTDKLSGAIGGFGEALFGSGPLNRAKGELYRSRIGSNDALTGHRLAQTRDLDYQHGQKQDLIKALRGETDPSMLQGVQFGDPKNYVGANNLNNEAIAKAAAMERIRARDPQQADFLDVGQGLHPQAMANRLNLIAPEEVNKLQAETQNIKDEFGLAESLNNANIGLIKQQRNTSGALGGKYRQQTANLMNKGLMDEQTGLLNLKKIEAEMGQDAAESAQRINTLKSSKAEFDKNFQLAQEKLTQLQQKGQNLKTAMENMAKITVEGDVTLADFAAVGGLKEAASRILGGTQVGGTKALEVIDKVMTRLQGDQDTEYLVDDGKGGQARMTYPDMNEKQRDIIFNREIEKYVDVMARHLNIHPSEARKRLMRGAGNSGGGSGKNFKGMAHPSGKKGEPAVNYRQQLDDFTGKNSPAVPPTSQGNPAASTDLGSALEGNPAVPPTSQGDPAALLREQWNNKFWDDANQLDTIQGRGGATSGAGATTPITQGRIMRTDGITNSRQEVADSLMKHPLEALLEDGVREDIERLYRSEGLEILDWVISQKHMNIVNP